MPGPEGSEGELDVESLLTDAGSAQDTQQLQEGQVQQSTAQGQAKLYGGKYKTLEDYDKAHRSQQSQYTKAQQKLKTLDGILRNPGLLAAAKQDPALREALAQAGYAQVEEEAAEAEQRNGNRDWNGDENDPRYIRMEFQLSRQLDKETAKLERELGREFRPEEWEEIKQVYKAVSGISLNQAWKLTTAFEKLQKTAEDRRVNDAVSKRQGAFQRPKPPSALSPAGQKIDLKKDPSTMNDQERTALINEIYNNPGNYK